MPLKELEVKYASKRQRAYKLSDGGGMHLLVQPSGSKLWRLKYRFEGKEKLLSFGKYPAVTLAMARKKRGDAKAALDARRDPAEDNKAAKNLAASPELFELVAQTWHANRKDGLDPAHADRVLRRMERDVFPKLGTRNINSITPPDVLDVVRAVEARGALDISRRVKQGIGQVFRFAIANGWAKVDPTISLNDALKSRRKVRHMPKVTLAELPGLVSAIRNYDGEADSRRRETTRDAMLFILPTWARSGGTRLANRDEFEELDGDKPISSNTMIYACNRMGYLGRQTIHAFGDSVRPGPMKPNAIAPIGSRWLLRTRMRTRLGVLIAARYI